MRCVITLLTVPLPALPLLHFFPVIIFSNLPPRVLSLSLSFSLCLCLSLRGDAVTYARLQHQKLGDEERMTGTVNNGPEWGFSFSPLLFRFFWCLVLPSIHSTSIPMILYTTLKKATRLNYFCKWLHCCVFLFSLDWLYIWYLVCLSFVTHCL